MNLRQAAAQAAQTLARHRIPDAPIEAEVLLRHILQYDRARYFASLNDPLDGGQQARIDGLIGRRVGGEPLAYITGRREFYALDFIVNADTLIPRQETELLVDKALEWARAQRRSALTIADVGTGSGAIAVALAQSLPDAKIYATDISAAALEVAAQNCRKHGVADRVALMRGDLLTPLPRKVDAIVSNPPYIATELMPCLQREVQREPRIALDGGADGTGVIRRLIAQAAHRLNSGGLMLIEISPEQADDVAAMAQAHFADAAVSVAADILGLARCVEVSYA